MLNFTAKQAQNNYKENRQKELERILKLIEEASKEGKYCIFVDSLSTFCNEKLTEKQEDESVFKIDTLGAVNGGNVKIHW